MEAETLLSNTLSSIEKGHVGRHMPAYAHAELQLGGEAQWWSSAVITRVSPAPPRVH